MHICTCTLKTEGKIRCIAKNKRLRVYLKCYSKRESRIIITYTLHSVEFYTFTQQAKGPCFNPSDVVSRRAWQIRNLVLLAVMTPCKYGGSWATFKSTQQIQEQTTNFKPQEYPPQTTQAEKMTFVLFQRVIWGSSHCSTCTGPFAPKISVPTTEITS